MTVLTSAELAPPQVVERIENPTVEEFQREIMPNGKPVIITGVADAWPALSRWTFDFFRSLVGDVEAEMRSSDQEEELFFGKFTATKVKLADYFEALKRGREAKASRPYLGNISFKDEGAAPFLSVLRPDFSFPRYFRDHQDFDERIWIASAGQKSTIHNDNYHNFNAQVSGVKKFILFAPEDYRYLYTERLNEGCWVSRVDGFAPNLDRFPLFTHARPFACTLTAGEILYVPLFWWHQVYAETACINVNAWIFRRGGHVFWAQ